MGSRIGFWLQMACRWVEFGWEFVMVVKWVIKAHVTAHMFNKAQATYKLEDGQNYPTVYSYITLSDTILEDFLRIVIAVN